MNLFNVRRYAALISVALSISFLIYFLAAFEKLPIRVIVTPFSIMVEINPTQPPPRLNKQQAIFQNSSSFKVTETATFS
jgi:hypothetical protein